ncbi:MAG: IS1634 family transposase [Anaerolineaceae bacterium]|nr:IS1634 family transposase [Anaerolineaceae bacterium]
MIRKDKKIYADGTIKTQIRVVEGYRPGPGMPPKQRTIKNFGYLEDQTDQEAFLEMVKQFDKEQRKEAVTRIEVPATAKMYSEGNQRQNYGYKFLEAIYNSLKIDRFIKEYLKQKKSREKYPAEEIIKFLVIQRILAPDSKRTTIQKRDTLYGFNSDFELHDIYRALDLLAEMEIPIQQYINEQIKEKIGRDLSLAFYGVTNYYFEKDFPDETGLLRQRGVSKEHRVDPIVQMGMFIDGKGLPVCMSLFPGNTSDSVTLLPSMKMIKESYGFGRLIVVADKGMNSGRNLDEICNNGDGYVVSQIIRGTKGKRYHAYIADEIGWIENEEKTYKYKLFEEEYEGFDSSRKKITRCRKVLLYWNQADAKMASRKREEKLEKAVKSAGNNVYSIAKGVEEYSKVNIVNKDTGELIENPKKVLSVDFEKAEKDAKFDAYFCIITSELDYSENQIRSIYGGLWKIEQSFRILKSDLYARPVFVSSQLHIKAHFLICFISLLVVRLLQYRMGENALSPERISTALNCATCQVLRGGIIHLDDVGGSIAFVKKLNNKGVLVDTLKFSSEDQIAGDYKLIQNTFHSAFYDAYPKQEVFNKFLNNLSI